MSEMEQHGLNILARHILYFCQYYGRLGHNFTQKLCPNIPSHLYNIVVEDSIFKSCGDPNTR